MIQDGSHMSRRKIRAVTVAMAAALIVAAGASLGAFTSIKPYAIGIDLGYETVPLLSVGDVVPETSDPSKDYQMIGIPDGLGAHPNGDGTFTLFMNHELTSPTISEPVIGDPRNRGAFVSKYIIDAATGDVISGERAYDTVFLDDTPKGPAADESNASPAFSRFCSGTLAGPEHGFDRLIYFPNEEDATAATFDGLGGLAVAVFDNKAYGLTYLGHFAWENTVPQPHPRGNRVVIMSMEDGPVNQNPADDNSQLYMYVGTKNPAGTDLEKNGLVGGTLYAFRSKDSGKNSEQNFQRGTITGEWVAIPGANAMSAVQLEAATDAAGAMVFARPEDGTFNPRNKNEYFFVTTGGAIGANELGRLYSLRLDPSDPTRQARLTVLYNADQVIASGGDIAISPDNIGTSRDYLMVQEDGTTQSRLVMEALGRDGSIWRFPLGTDGVDVSQAERIVELDPPGRNGSPPDPPVGAGI